MMSMCKQFMALIVYNFRKVNKRNLVLLYSLFVVITIIYLITYQRFGISMYFDPTEEVFKTIKGNMWDNIYELVSYELFFPISILLICMYGTYCSFKKDPYEILAQTRSTSRFTYVNAKMAFVLAFNAIAFFIVYVTIILLSMTFFDIKMGWSPELMLLSEYTNIYNAFDFSVIIIITYIASLTTLSYLFGFLVLQTKHHLTGPIIVVAYQIFEKLLLGLDPSFRISETIKLCCMSTYLLVGGRNLFADDPYLISVATGIVLPIISMLLAYLLMLLALAHRKNRKDATLL